MEEKIACISAAPTTGDYSKDKFITQFLRIKATPENLVGAMTRAFWSACVWKNNQRSVKNFEFSDFCALDFESPNFTLEQALDAFCDMRHIIGITRNHRISKDGAPAVDRFRILIPWERRITDAFEYKYNMRKLAEKWDSDLAATSAQHPFFPCTKIIRVDMSQDYCMDVNAVEDNAGLQKFLKRQSEYLRRGVLSRQTSDTLRHVVPKGFRHNAFFKAACELARAGLSLEDIRDRILSSPTFKGTPDSLDLRKIKKNVGEAIEDAYGYVHSPDGVRTMKRRDREL